MKMFVALEVLFSHVHKNFQTREVVFIAGSKAKAVAKLALRASRENNAGKALCPVVGAAIYPFHEDAFFLANYTAGERQPMTEDALKAWKEMVTNMGWTYVPL